jgi:flagellar motor component MotA
MAWVRQIFSSYLFPIRLNDSSPHRRTCKQIVVQGILAIQEGLNPRLVEEKLSIYLAEHSAASQEQTP